MNDRPAQTGEELNTVYLFSNKVVQHPFKSLLAGQVQTTYGTDFNCAESIIEQDLDKAGVFTDGYADLRPELQTQLRERRVRILTLLFGGKTDCPAFAPLGDVVQLEDISN